MYKAQKGLNNMNILLLAYPILQINISVKEH